MFQKSCRHALRGRVCVAVVAALVAVAPASLRAKPLTPQQQLAFDIYKELVEIDTTTATGDTKQAAEAMAARLRAAGFAEGDVQVFQPASRACAAREPASRSCCWRISTSCRPGAKTGRSIRSS
jgi:hypothetical protein